MGIQLRPVPASAGILWVRRAAAVFARRPAVFTGLFGLVVLGSLLLSAVPYLGQLLVAMAMPLVSLGFMIATESVLADGRIDGPRLVEPLARGSGSRRPLLRLCAFYLAGTLVCTLLSHWAGGDAIERLAESLSKSGAAGSSAAAFPNLVATPDLLKALGVFWGGMGLLSIPLWHAPALVHWGRQPALQALFSSALALWRTRGAFGVYTLAWIGLGTALAFGVALLTLLGLGALAMLLAVPAGFGLSTVFYLSLYFCFMDTFEIALVRGPAATAEARS